MSRISAGVITVSIMSRPRWQRSILKTSGVSGTVRLTAGPVMSYADSWRLTLRGRQSHGSQPENSMDPIVLGAHIVTRLQTVVSREISALQSAVVTVVTFHGGLKENIIPATAEFTLNIRSLDDTVRGPVLAAVRRIISAVDAASGAPEPQIEELYRFPRNLNDVEETEALREHLVGVLGEQNVVDGKPFMGSEDFGTLAESIGVPTVFWFFGGFTEEQMAADDVPVNHSPQFLPVMEPTLSTGYAAAMTAILSKLSKASKA
ncbi:peptidase dimerization domain-containing protein, partial [Kocuria sp. p3-SID1433]